MGLFRLSNTDRKVKYPPTAVTMRTSYRVTHASRTSNGMSIESNTMKMNSTTTRDNTIMGRVCLANHESECVVRGPTFGQLGFHRDPFRHDEVVEFDPLFMGDIVVQVHQVFDDSQNTRIGEGITYGIK